MLLPPMGTLCHCWGEYCGRGLAVQTSINKYTLHRWQFGSARNKEKLFWGIEQTPQTKRSSSWLRNWGSVELSWAERRRKKIVNEPWDKSTLQLNLTLRFIRVSRTEEENQSHAKWAKSKTKRVKSTSQQVFYAPLSSPQWKGIFKNAHHTLHAFTCKTVFIQEFIHPANQLGSHPSIHLLTALPFLRF